MHRYMDTSNNNTLKVTRQSWYIYIMQLTIVSFQVIVYVLSEHIPPLFSDLFYLVPEPYEEKVSIHSQTKLNECSSIKVIVYP